MELHHHPPLPVIPPALRQPPLLPSRRMRTQTIPSLRPPPRMLQRRALLDAYGEALCLISGLLVKLENSFKKIAGKYICYMVLVNFVILNEFFIFF